MIKDAEKLNRDLCTAGSKVYYWEPDHAWSIGEVEADDGKVFSVKGIDYSASKKGKLLTIDKLSDDKVWPIREDVLDEDVDDLLDLTILHDATIQRCLFVRYMRDVVYTNIGAIVVALNPWNFKIPWYTDDNMPKYLAEGEVIKDNLPHSWAQAHNTWHDLRRDNENQTILISGESGAGKTEAAKIVMKYLGCLSCIHGSNEDKENAKKVAFNINQASPVLEGFGNAKTVRNDNSSRFGKFMKVQFNATGNLVGAYTIKYLLEKSRIVTSSKNERVYHAFYLLSKGSDAGKYNITDIQNSHINAGEAIDIPGVDDGEDYSLCLTAMRDCGFSEDDIDAVWRVVAGVFHCLRTTFSEIDDDSCEVSSSGKEHLSIATGHWGVDVDNLCHEFTTLTLETREGPVEAKLNATKSLDARDAVCKALYDQVFGWEVEKINQNTDSGTGENFIGLLDIFGFEDFEYNSFEQICINLANETLQNHYNNFIFNKDMDDCRAEGIDVTEVKCPDNGPCLRLMTDKVGIFGLLDDECSMGKGSDSGFMSKVEENCSSNPFFELKKLSKSAFIVHHYAASVVYTVEGWLDKNRDTLKPTMKSLMRSSSVPLIASLIPQHDENAKKVTVGGFFREQLTLLMNLINSTSPHWIRCVKPHPAKKPLLIDGITMMSQLESSGVLGTVKIRKAGYPVRPTFVRFLGRYKVIVGGPYPAMDSPAKTLADFSQKVLQAAGFDKQKAQVGKTRVFLKNDANQKLEALRVKALQNHILCLKRCSFTTISELVTRKKKWAEACRTIQEEVRSWIDRTAATRAELKKARMEQIRVFTAEQNEIINNEQHGRNTIESEMTSEFLDLKAELFEDSRILRGRLENDNNDREDMLLTCKQDKELAFSAAIPFFAELKQQLIGNLIFAIQETEEIRRKQILPEQDKCYRHIIDLFEYELGFVQLTTMLRSEISQRHLLLQLESLQRNEATDRRGMLQLFMDSLDDSAYPWIESLGAVKFWSDHISKRKRRIEDTRTHLKEVRLYDEQQSSTVNFICHREPPERTDRDSVWKGCTGVPDIEQMKKSHDRAPLSKPQRTTATRTNLDGNSGHPSRDASPLRNNRVPSHNISSPPRTGGTGKHLIAKSPILPDHIGHQQHKKELKGLAPKLGNIGTYTVTQFLVTRRKMVEMFLKLKEAGQYPYDGKYSYETNISCIKDLRLAQDTLHDLRATLCSELSKQLVSKMAFAKRNRVLEQNPVTGQWKQVRCPEWSEAAFQDNPGLWEELKSEKERISKAIQGNKSEMVAILKTVSEMGQTVLSQVTTDTPFTEVKSVFNYWVRSHAKDIPGKEEEVFSILSRRYGGGPEVHIPAMSPRATAPGKRPPKTPKAHINSCSPSPKKY
eukprot:TRINITY_DN6929_c2_g3_i1.p1 TRINITY_DN6929_c2_g3~~TRINITY_DN6929_c2_g3_i1.p1  ORF type:complete len:1372 (+),score=332.35 TRINITY_DN6929_c2_g3_i1:58-4173(+)